MPFTRPREGHSILVGRRFSLQMALLWLLAVLFLVPVWVHTETLIEDDRIRTMADAERDVVNLGRLSQEHAERIFYSADQTLRLVLGQYLEHNGKPDLQAMREQGVIDPRILVNVSVIDAQGRLEQSSLPFTGQVDLSDQDYFKVHAASDSSALFISSPGFDAASGQGVIQLSRRISLNDGRFRGVIVVSLDPGYFSRFYGELRLGQQGVASLLGLDGSVRAERRAGRAEFTGDPSAMAVFAHLAEGAQFSTVTLSSKVDGVERTHHFRRLSSYPLVVSIGMASQDIFVDHAQIRLQRIRQAALASVLILLLAAVCSWYLLARRRFLQNQTQALSQLQELTRQVPGVVYQYLLRPDGSSSLPFASEGLRHFCPFDPADLARDASPLFPLIHAYDAPGVEASIEASARTLTPWEHEFRVKLADSSLHWLAGSAAPQRLADGSVLWHGLMTDITERKEREESQRTLSMAVEQSPVSILLVDLDGCIQYVNPMFERITGYTSAEVIGRNPRMFSSGDKSAADYRQLWDTLLAGKTWTGEFHNRSKDGTLFWEHATISPVFDVHGVQAHYLAIKEDITESKRQKAELAAEQARLQATINAIPDLLFEAGLDGRIYSFHSPRVDLLASAPKEFLGRLLADILPADATAVAIAALREAHEKGYSTGKQYQLVLAQGLAWFELSVARKMEVGGEEGPRFVALVRDITDRKNAEARLRIAAIAFESQEGMFVSDAAGVMLQVNQAFTNITGYCADEAVGKTPGLLSSGRHDAGFYTAMRDTLALHGAWQGEIWNRRKNGEVFPEWLTITAVKDDCQTVTNYVSTLTDITRRKAAEEKIKHLAFYDPLTGLPNRRLLVDRLNQAIASSTRSGREGALLFIDLDNFKSLNDAYGHARGDLLLQQVGERLQACTREGDTVARLGGDEYVVMIEDLSPRAREAASQAETLGEKILYALNLPFDLAGNEYHITPSIGVTLFADHRNSADELMKRADLAMYQAKAAGRNTLRFFDPEMQAAVNARVAMERDLRDGLHLNQFLLLYQPQVDQQGRLTGVEALVRWRHPQAGMMSPVDFIPLAEESGLILPLGHQVLQAACLQLKAWASHVHTAQLTMSVNVSALQFHLDGFVAEVLAVIHATGAPPSRLKLELTESLLVKDVESIIGKMLELKAHGVSFSLDDFGTGYSSLSYLKRLPLDQLKIDQSFLHEALTNANDAAIVRAIVALGKSLGMMVIAEGVETSAQRDFLLNEGCQHFQGYYFGRPAPVEALEVFFQ
jgi:diguanylate cyclase (GGDEF)-like protein/PAS domain S-box-containing protein